MNLDFTGVFILIGVVGWGFIEIIIWLSSFVTIG